MTDNSDDIDVVSILNKFWEDRLLIVSVALISIAVSAALVFLLPNKYTCSVTLVAVDHSERNKIPLSDGLGSVASLIGLRASNKQDTAVALEMVQSWGFIESFVKERNIASEVYAVNGWDKNKNRLEFDRSIYNPEKKEWMHGGYSKSDKDPEPGSWRLYKKFMRYFHVETNERTGFVTMSVTYVSPYVAAEWLGWLVSDINETYRKNDISVAEKKIKYLTEQINNNKVAEVNDTLYQMVSDQMKLVALAKSQDEYVFKKIQKIKVPEEKSSPRRGVILAMGSAIGVGLVLIVVYFRKFIIKTV